MQLLHIFSDLGALWIELDCYSNEQHYKNTAIGKNTNDDMGLEDMIGIRFGIDKPQHSSRVGLVISFLE